MPDTVISVEHLSKAYRLGQIGTGTLSRDLQVWWARTRGKPNPLLRIGQKDHGNRDGETIWALKDVSFKVKQGEVLGIIGRNGAGKSTLLKIITGVTAPTSGQVKAKGRVASLLEVGTGFHPELTGRENIYLNGTILGMEKAEIARKFDEIVAFSEVEQFIDTPVKRYSSGMYVRLAFAVAAHLEPEILLVDEVLAVGDIAFQRKCVSMMRDAGHSGRTVLVVSHNMQSIAGICGRALWLDSGKCVSEGDAGGVVSQYERAGIAASSQGDCGRIARVPRPSAPAWIDWLETKDVEGHFTSVFAHGESMDLFVGINGRLPNAPYFEWVLYTDKGQVATSGGTFFAEKDFPLPTPSGSLLARIGPLPLAEGRYSLQLRLGEQPGNEVMDVWQDATTLVVTSCVPHAGGIPFDTRRGVVYIPAQYSDGGGARSSWPHASQCLRQAGASGSLGAPSIDDETRSRKDRVNSGAVSVCVTTYNAEEYLDKCLSSVLWCDERVVVDLGSSDRTLEIAASFKCRIVEHAWVPVVEMIRDEMVNLCANDWVLVLDPDEAVPPTLADRLKQVAADGQADAVSIPRKNYMFGQLIANSGWNADRHIRFFRKGAVAWSSEVHESGKVVGSVLRLPHDEKHGLIHFAYDSVTQFVQKLDRYTSAEAVKPANLHLGESVAEMSYAPFSELSRRYFRLHGYKDGVRGLAACMLMAFYWATTSLKVAELRSWSSEEDDHILSQSRKGVLRGMAELLKGLYDSAETWWLRLIYGVLWSLVALAIRVRAF